MDRKTYDTYISILKNELIPSMGCTEPIAIAYAAAKARDILGEFPEWIAVKASGNVIKNVKGVIVPNSGGLKGIEASAVLGVISGKDELELEVLSEIEEKDIELAKILLKKNICSCELEKGVDNLYICVEVGKGDNKSEVILKSKHKYISEIKYNGEIIFAQDINFSKNTENRDLLNIRNIIDFADNVKIEDIEDILNRQIKYNTEISIVGMEKNYGANIGKNLMKFHEDSIINRAKAKAASGSDARMGGCAMPVVINSGSGNQGITITIPILEYSKSLNIEYDKTLRALALANLIAIHQKRFIGSLSAFCGAVCAGCAAACGVAYMQGADYELISDTIINTLCNIGGMVCDGAKPSCAAKIATALEAALMGYELAKSGNKFQDGEGLVMEDVEKTIRNIGRLGKEGMKETDIEILNMMLGK